MKVVTIVGARPQFIKAAAVSGPLREVAHEVLVHTGQHYDHEMSDAFFEELKIPSPDYQLDVGSGSHAWQTAEVMRRLEPVLLAERPDWVLVYGDTNSTLAGALTAAKIPLRVVHVEAGLRSFDPKMPEEINRIVTDQLSTLCLAPSAAAAGNLAAEGLAARTVEVGDVMVDLLLKAMGHLPPSSPLANDLRIEHGRYVVATIHRAATTDDPRRMTAAVDLLAGIGMRVLMPLHPRTARALEAFGLRDRLVGGGAVILLPPIGYLDLMMLVRDARAVLTDSGGLQKEAYVLGTQCITLRVETEWVETVEAGWNSVVDLDLEAARTALAEEPPQIRPSLYGDGHAAEKSIAAIVREG